MRTFRTSIATALCALATAAVSCEKIKTPQSGELTGEEKEMKAIVEQYVPNVIYSIYADLARESSELYELLKAAAEKETASLSQTELEAIAEKFLQARQSWEESEAFLFGAATDFGIDPHIDTWPLDVDALATSLSNADQVEQLRGEDGILYAGGKLGKELLGFHGIEFVIFRNGEVRKAAELNAKETDPAFGRYDVSGKQELIYAAAVAGDLRDNCWQLCASWNEDCEKEYTERCEELEVNVTVTGSERSYGRNMLGAASAGSSYASWQEAIGSILIAGCSNICNEVANVKMGNAHTGEDINYIESPYSKKSFQDFIDNILSIQYSLYGKSGATTAGSESIMSYLRNHGYQGVSALEESLENTLKALRTCQSKGAFVDIYADDSVQAAMDAANSLDAQLNQAASWIVLQ